MVARNIAGEVILVPIRHDVAELESIYALNETAARIWALIDASDSPGAIASQRLEDYDVSPAVAAQDVAATLARLREIGAPVAF